MRSAPITLLFLLAGIEGVFAGSAGRSSSAGREIVREMNLARQHPDVYARHLEELRGRFRGKILVLPGKTMLHTREGVDAVEEGIRFLHNQRPLPALAFSAGIARAAAEHVAEQADGSLGHEGSDRSDPGARMNRHGSWSGRWGENISYGKTNARDIVIALIIDDGLRGRKHRKNIFNPQFNVAGAALGPHARYRTVCSIDFAGGYVEDFSASRSLVARN